MIPWIAAIQEKSVLEKITVSMAAAELSMHSIYLKEITMHLTMKAVGIDIFETRPSESGQIKVITENALCIKTFFVIL